MSSPGNRKLDCRIHHNHPNNWLHMDNLKWFIEIFISDIPVSMLDVIYRSSMRCFLLRIRLYKRHHRLDSSKCTQLDWFHNVPYKPSLNPEPWKSFSTSAKTRHAKMANAMSSKKHRNLQTLSEWVEVIRLARDQSQNRYQNGESHFVKFIQTLRRFIRTPYAIFPRTPFFATPITHNEILA